MLLRGYPRLNLIWLSASRSSWMSYPQQSRELRICPHVETDLLFGLLWNAVDEVGEAFLVSRFSLSLTYFSFSRSPNEFGFTIVAFIKRRHNFRGAVFIVCPQYISAMGTDTDAAHGTGGDDSVVGFGGFWFCGHSGFKNSIACS